MKTTKLVALTSFIFSLSLTVGCQGPRLARRPLTPEQQAWAEAMQKWHPDWKQPYLAPVRYGRQYGAADKTAVPVDGNIPATTEQRLLPPVADFSTDQGGTGEDDFVLVPLNEQGQEMPEQETVYTVQKGDTLSHIAVNLYGRPGAWRDIYAANRDVLSSPDDLSPGLQLTIPARGN
ncbi:MAG: LysM peptidoglycan-binding domain-containing protein [Candidatus Pacebacteria bacterium]|nr:LysM peptidoglycan-binding domain-containing protein [Candidatus Paceibacterota bacterium]